MKECSSSRGQKGEEELAKEARQSAESAGTVVTREGLKYTALESKRGLTRESPRAWLQLEIMELYYCELA